MTPEQQQAEAVISGLADRLEFSCDCGKLHYLPTEKYEAPRVHNYRPRKQIECACGSRHSWSSVYCRCGASWEYGPRAGWRCVFRKHGLWKSREAMLTDHIAFLEAQLANR